MAQANDIKSTSKAQTSPTFQQLLQREGSKWSHISTEKLKKKNNQEHNHNKKSVLAKVKEKAKKLKHSLSIKKHHHENDPPSTSVTRVSTSGSKDKGEQDVEFHNARMSESKNIPNTNKHETKDHPQEAPTPVPKKHSATSKDEPPCSSNTIKDADSKNQAPSDTSPVGADTDAKHQVPSVIAADTDTKNQSVAATTDVLPEQHELSGSISRFSNLTVSTPSNDDRSIEEGENMKGESSQTPDKGVSVKEYLMQKLEPGEDERALSQIITQTISPRRDKVREAMSSFLKNDETSTSKNSNSEANSSDADNATNPIFKSKSLPTSVKTEPKIAPIVQSHSLGSNASKNLNQTFKSIVASYQNNLNSSTTSSSNEGSSPKCNNSSTTRVPASRNLLGVVEEENEGKVMQAK